MGYPRAGPSCERKSGQTTATDFVSVGIPPHTANQRARDLDLERVGDAGRRVRAIAPGWAWM